jgi:hypothetical protein
MNLSILIPLLEGLQNIWFNLVSITPMKSFLDDGSTDASWSIIEQFC